jgi:SNF2 family DNA or RNA helicase
VAKWNRGEIPLMMGHPQSIGHGLNLQEACNTVCFFGPIWDLELYLQFIARVWRQGSPFGHVMIHHIICKNTRDEKVAKAIEKKEVNQAEFDAALVSNL